jgi:ParB-like chromosome segregation protein Spo0J
MANNKFVAGIRKINELISTHKSYKIISNNQERKLLKSINEYDLAQPIVINSNNKIIDGNFRVKLLIENGDMDKEVPVMVSTTLLSDKSCTGCYRSI